MEDNSITENPIRVIGLIPPDRHSAESIFLSRLQLTQEITASLQTVCVGHGDLTYANVNVTHRLFADAADIKLVVLVDIKGTIFLVVADSDSNPIQRLSIPALECKFELGVFGHTTTICIDVRHAEANEQWRLWYKLDTSTSAKAKSATLFMDLFQRCLMRTDFDQIQYVNLPRNSPAKVNLPQQRKTRSGKRYTTDDEDRTAPTPVALPRMRGSRYRIHLTRHMAAGVTGKLLSGKMTRSEIQDLRRAISGRRRRSDTEDSDGSYR